MNVFVLSTGRCGTETFVRACEHMTNYSVAHESHNRWLHPHIDLPYRNLRYPDRHIEADNRLSWFLGALEREYGGGAYYVHLIRNREEVARSVAGRGRNSILYAFASGILQLYDEADDLSDAERLELAGHYWDTVNENIRVFLKDKPRQQTIWLHQARTEFPQFWTAIDAQGDLGAALAEWDTRHNASKARAGAGWPSARRSAAQQQAIAAIALAVPPEHAYILIDDDHWAFSRATGGRRRLLLGGLGGRYAGPPKDDAACRDQLIEAWNHGARALVIATDSRWWLDRFPGLANYLKNDCQRLMETEHFQIFRLSNPLHSAAQQGFAPGSNSKR